MYQIKRFKKNKVVIEKKDLSLSKWKTKNGQIKSLKNINPKNK